MNRMALRFWHIVRYRGSFLLFLAILDGLISYSLWSGRNTVAERGHLMFSWQVWATGWGITALVCLVCAFLAHDRVAFTLATLMKTAWGALELRLWLGGHTPNGWVGVTVWWTFAAVIAIISAWPDPPKLLQPPVELPNGNRLEQPGRDDG